MKSLGMALVALVLTVSVYAQKPMTEQQWAGMAVRKYKLSSIARIDSSPNPKTIASRSQIALVVFTVAVQLIDRCSSLDTKIRDLDLRIDDFNGQKGEDKELVKKRLRSEVIDLKSSVDRVMIYRDDIDRLYSLTKDYASELQMLGVDTGQVEK